MQSEVKQVRGGGITPSNFASEIESIATGSGGGGNTINGIIEQYTVGSENINAGDFVSFITNVSSEIGEAAYGNTRPWAVLLDDNKVFIAHGVGNNLYLWGTLIAFNSSSITILNSTQLNNNNYSCYQTCSAVALDNNKIFIAHAYGTSAYLYGTLVTINSDHSMTAISQQLDSTSNSCNIACSALLLENNKVFIAHGYGSSRYLHGTIVTINNNVITVASSKDLNSATNYSCNYYCSATKLENNKVFIAYAYSNSNYLYGTIVLIDSANTMTANTKKLDSTSYSCAGHCWAFALNNTTVLVAHPYSMNDKGQGTIITVEGTTMSVTSSTTLNSASDAFNTLISAAILEDKSIFILHSHTSNRHLAKTTAVIDEDNHIINPTTTIISSENDSCYNGISNIIVNNEGDIFAAHGRVLSGSTSVYLYGYVQPKLPLVTKVLNSTTAINGIAAETGTSNETIGVYVPSFN